MFFLVRISRIFIFFDLCFNLIKKFFVIERSEFFFEILSLAEYELVHVTVAREIDEHCACIGGTLLLLVQVCTGFSEYDFHSFQNFFWGSVTVENGCAREFDIILEWPAKNGVNRAVILFDELVNVGDVSNDTLELQIFGSFSSTSGVEGSCD